MYLLIHAGLKLIHVSESGHWCCQKLGTKKPTDAFPVYVINHIKENKYYSKGIEKTKKDCFIFVNDNNNDY